MKRILLAAGLLAACAAAAGTRTWYATHWEAVTGRKEAPSKGCLYCHERPPLPPVSGAPSSPRYLSPEGLAVSPDGGTLYVAAENGGEVLSLNPETGAILARAAVPGRPHDIALFDGGRRLAVSSRDTDRIFILEADALGLLGTIETGHEPLGLAVAPGGKRIFAAQGMSNDVLIAPLRGEGKRVRLPAGVDPYAISLSRDGRLLAVLNRRVFPEAPGEIPSSEITLIDASRERVRERRELRSAHMGEGIAVSADGSFALATTLRIRNLLPTTQVARGAVMNSALVYLETRPGGLTVQFPLCEVNRYFADPAGVVLTPDDRTAFVAHAGSDLVTVVDIHALRRHLRSLSPRGLARLPEDLSAGPSVMRAQLPTRSNPRKLAVSPDGTRLYVSEHLSDSVAVFDTRSLKLLRRLDLGGPRRLTAARRGSRTFFNGERTFQGQFSCRSCHPDGHTDGLIWDFEIDGLGKELLETRSLRGIKDTAPFKWRGKNSTIARQCGIRFARVLTRADPIEGRKLDDLVAFIKSIPLPPKRISARLAEARERGRKLFFREKDSRGAPIPVRDRCGTCHHPPLFTDRLMTDVGTGGRFDDPHLIGVGESAPYLHDGRALSIEEIWTKSDPDRVHGHTEDMNKLMLNDLTAYLKSL